MTLARVITESGLTKVELAQLYGVSRQALHYWRTVAPPREGSYLARMVEPITQALIRAIDRHTLPLGAMGKEARQARVTKMAALLQNLKPAPAKG